MAKGLEQVQADKLVHRDVAARNVLQHKKEPKITDFGMSRLIEDNSMEQLNMNWVLFAGCHPKLYEKKNTQPEALQSI